MMERKTLPQELRTRAEWFFRVSLAGLEVRVEPLVEAMGAAAVTYGRQVYLSPGSVDFEREDHRRLLGHELAHVVQQLEGRVPATSRILGLPLNEDPALEAEAEELGRRFATGAAPPTTVRSRPRLPCSSREPVVQRSVIVAGLLLENSSQLSEPVSQVIRLIGGGRAWLDWAMAEPREIFRFSDPPALAEGIQSGLHGSPWMLLRRSELLVSSKKLLQLPADLLTSIWAWETDGGTRSQGRIVQAALRRNELWTHGELASASQFLADHQVADAQIFQEMRLADQISLLHLLNDPDTVLGGLSDELTTEAARFAVAQASNPLEFVDYLQFYLATVERLGFKKTTKGGVSDAEKAKLQHRAEAVLEEMAPFLGGLLRCPTFDSPPGPVSLHQALKDWIGGGHVLGFGRISAATDQIYRHSGLRQQTGAEMGRIIDGFIARGQRFLASTRPSSGVLSQDGITWSYRVDGADGKATLRLGGDGGLILKEFVPEPSEDPGQAGPEESKHAS